MNTINVGMIGFGTVGTGLAKLFFEQQERLDRRFGRPLRLTKVADLDITTDRGVPVPEGVLTTSVDDILNDPEISIVVELMGGLEPALSFIKRAITSGKQVVTANKALLAHHGNEIFALAEKHEVGLFFEAAVCGGIPLIRSFREGLAANRISSFVGILNGTSNYILTRMSDGGEDFEPVLAQAQAEGLAEADPTLDIEGIDAAHKLALLISLSFGGPLPFDQLSIEGVTKVEAVDVANAREFGYAIKLIAVAKRDGDLIEARVHPAFIPQNHVLAAVGGAFNAVHVTADPVGDVLLYGLGAGGNPTASAVAGDIFEAARNVVTGVGLRLPNLGEPDKLKRPIKLQPIDDLLSRYYVRVKVLDQPGVLSSLAGVLAKHEISIESVVQKGRAKDHVPVVMIIHQAREAGMRQALTELSSMDFMASDPVFFRIEDNI